MIAIYAREEKYRKTTNRSQSAVHNRVNDLLNGLVTAACFFHRDIHKNPIINSYARNNRAHADHRIGQILENKISNIYGDSHCREWGQKIITALRSRKKTKTITGRQTRP